MDKECEICGGFFTPYRSYQKYCSECGKDSYNLKIKLQKNLDRIARMYYEPTYYKHICKQCGEEFESTSKVQDLCSAKCRIKHRRETAVCEYCGKNLLEQGIEIQPNQTRGLYCNDECREKAKWKRAKEDGRIGKCPQCGKEFIRQKNGKTYCGMECYKAANEARKAEAAKKPKMCKCTNCGKVFSAGTGINAWGTSLNGAFCSKECANKYEIKIAENKQRLKQHKQAVAEKKASRDKERFIKQNGLCGICKTAYSDCERMQSNFTYSPKGAYFENGKVTKCPKFKG